MLFNSPPPEPPYIPPPDRFDHLPRHRIDLATGFPLPPRKFKGVAPPPPPARKSPEHLRRIRRLKSCPEPDRERASLKSLPPELILDIADYLKDPLDKICFRHTCSYTLKFTQLDHDFMSNTPEVNVRNMILRIRFLDMTGLGGRGIDKVRVIGKMREQAEREAERRSIVAKKLQNEKVRGTGMEVIAAI